MELVPLGPGFGVEVKGVEPARRRHRCRCLQGRARGLRGAFAAGVPRPADRRRHPGRLQPRLRAARTHQGRLAGRRQLLFAPDQRRRQGRDRAADHRQVLVAKANALWHTDSSFKKTPALASVLTARVLPGEDGDTEFTSTRLAWERLPADLQAQAAGCRGDPFLCQQPRPDPSRPRQCRGAQGAAAGALAAELAQPGQRPARALCREPCLCDRRHGRPRRPPAAGRSCWTRRRGASSSTSTSGARAMR